MDIALGLWDSRGQVDRLIRYHDNGDGTYSPVAYIPQMNQSGTPVAGAAAASTSPVKLSTSSLPCKGVLVFPTDASADVYVGDSTSQPCRIPGIGIYIPVDDASKLYGRLSTGTGDIPWLAIV